MSNIEMEVVVFDDFDGDEEDAKGLVEQFIQRSEHEVDPKKTRVHDEEGNFLWEEINGKTRRSAIPWDSIAVLVASNPQMTLDFLRWATEYPGLTIGFATMDGTRLKVFSDNALIKIEGSLNIDLTVIGSYSQNKNVVEVPESKWKQIQDAQSTGDLDIDMPEENKVGP